jgi:hypothetical protein
MKVILILYVTLFLTLFYVTMPKKLHLLEQWFIWMFFVFFYTSFISIIVDNTELWVLSEKVAYVWHFKLFQIVLLPVIILFFLHSIILCKKRWQKGIVVVVFIITFLLSEQLLIYTSVIRIRDWSLLQSILTWFTILTITLYVQISFRNLLKKEGVLKQ